MRTCSKCKDPKDEEDFHKKTNGNQSICKECRKEYIKDHYNLNKEKYKKKATESRLRAKTWYDEFKSSLKCEECGENHPACLDFHHKERVTKEYTVASLRQSRKKLLKEVEKCKVLCSNCHRKLHYDENMVL